MSRIIAVGGVPGSGKTSLMKRVLQKVPFRKCYDEVPLVPYMQFADVIVLGKYDDNEVFGGTDKMSMAVQPHALQFVNNLLDLKTVVYEGDRLFGTSFIEELINSGHAVEIVILDVDRDLLDERYKQRGSNQNETWLAGRHSKVNNIRSNLEWLDIITVLPNNNEQELASNVEYIAKKLNLEDE